MYTSFSQKVYDMAIDIVDEALDGKYRNHPAREYFQEELSYEFSDMGVSVPQSLKMVFDNSRTFFVNLDEPCVNDDLKELSDFLDDYLQNLYKGNNRNEIER